MKANNLILVTFLSLIVGCGSPDLPENHGQVEQQFYLGGGEQQPLIVGLGGSEGGNAWTSDYWAKTRNQFIDSGYAFLAIGYFGGLGTPPELDRIALEGIYDAIMKTAKNPKINANKIAIIGGSKGGELALLLASVYPEIKCVVGIVPSHCTFPSLTLSASTSSWMYQDREVAYVPATWSSVPAILKRDLRSAFEIMLEDKEAVQNALIKVEKIKGPVLLLSATKDESWPSTEMSEKVIERLESNNFQYEYQHIPIIGPHAAPLKHFDKVFQFLDTNFKMPSDKEL
jgi:dipeptidyl aminopeptidase/acylaminoacyl peptidase